MTEQRIHFHFSQVGGLNALRPLIDVLKEEHRLSFSMRRDIIGFFRKRGGASVMEVGPGNPFERISRIIAGSNPRMIITDTIDPARCPGGEQNHYFWEIGRSNNIPSIAYLDCWWKYRERFLYLDSGKPALPDIIATVDKLAEKEAKKAIPEHNDIRFVGSPYWEKISDMSEPERRTARADVYRELGLERKDALITYVSQPFEKYLGSVEQWGLTEKTVYHEITGAIDCLPPGERRRLVLLILLHPEENENRFDASGSDIRTIIKKGGNSQKYILSSRLVLGIFSILLVESLLMNIPTIPVHIGLKKEDMLMISSTGVCPGVHTREGLLERLSDGLTNNYQEKEPCVQYRKEATRDVVKRWRDIIKKVMTS